MSEDLTPWGHTPGKLWCRCATCQTQFQGDRLALRCVACATRFRALYLANSQATHPQESASE